MKSSRLVLLSIDLSIRELLGYSDAPLDSVCLYEQLLHHGQSNSDGVAIKIPCNKIRGCVSNTWVDCSLRPQMENGTFFRITGVSDSYITQGFINVLSRAIEENKLSPMEAHEQFKQPEEYIYTQYNIYIY